jgi:GTPase
MNRELTELVERVLKGEMAAVARLISKVEKKDPEATEVVKKIYGNSGKAHLIGITGPPGVGKSCLVASLVGEFRKRDMKVGVLAVDPTSPVTGGAFLGDRARMTESSRDKDVFIRSLASRGATGGLAEAVNTAADILDASGKDVILIETVGVGQSEIEITSLAHTVILTLMPGYGDSLQILKAGVMEVADIFVVNKADKPGADKTASELDNYQQVDEALPLERRWKAPVHLTCALKDEGVVELANTLSEHYHFLKNNARLGAKNKDRRLKQFLNILTREIREEFMHSLQSDRELQEWVDRLSQLKLDPYSASEQLVKMLTNSRTRILSEG